jgi:hypothetical protein
MRVALLLALMVGSLAACDATPLPAPGGQGTGGTTGGQTGGNGAGEPSAACGIAPGTSGTPTGGTGGTGHIPEPQSCGPTGLVGIDGNGDQCLGDTDCAAKAWCDCGQSAGSLLRQHPNACTSTQCRVDSDCPSGLCAVSSPGPGCAPTTGGRFCRTSHDTCQTDADCTSCGRPNGSLPDTCQYVRQVGHWQCATTALCGGG